MMLHRICAIRGRLKYGGMPTPDADRALERHPATDHAAEQRRADAGIAAGGTTITALMRYRCIKRQRLNIAQVKNIT